LFPELNGDGRDDVFQPIEPPDVPPRARTTLFTPKAFKPLVGEREDFAKGGKHLFSLAFT
jgi:hypothetical protein